MTAFDDFGSGYSNLDLLAKFQPDIIKIDMALIRNIHTDPIRQTIVKAILSMCSELSVHALAEGVESKEEVVALKNLGVQLFQGYYFAKPGFESLPKISEDAWLV